MFRLSKFIAECHLEGELPGVAWPIHIGTSQARTCSRPSGWNLVPELELQGRSPGQPKFRLDAGRNARQFPAEMQVRSQLKCGVDPARNVLQILAEMRGGSWPKRGGSWAGGPAAVQPPGARIGGIPRAGGVRNPPIERRNSPIHPSRRVAAETPS